MGTVLAEILDLDRVPADAHFFDDLGADSMVLARFCARLRKRADLPSPSMRDVYTHPTVRLLATATAVATGPAPAPAPVSGEAPTAYVGTPEPPAPSSGRARYLLCGSAQLLIFLGYLGVGKSVV